MLKLTISLATIFLLSTITMSQASELTEISVTIVGDSEILVDSTKLIRADVEIKNFDSAGDGYYFMKVIQLSTGKVLTESEIHPKDRGNEVWGVQIAYWLDENKISVATDELIGDYEIQIVTEFGTSTATTTFSIVESSQSESEDASSDTAADQVSTEKPISSQTSSNVAFRDSSGYTPSWAKGSGYHSVLLKCTEFVGDYSRDGNWCFEWTAYVLDQGVENFPESTKGTSSSSSSNLSERNCKENKLCAFPGEFLKYKNWDTFDDFEEIAIVEFKEKINDDTIRVFIDGFGSKPLTYNLNLKTGIETHDEYKNVNRPFNLLEPIPMKIGQKVSQIIEGSYESTIESERTANLKEMGLLMDVERTIMAAGTDLGNGDVVVRGYDKETGVLITSIEKYSLDGKKYTSAMALIDTNIFSSPTIISSQESVIQEKETQNISNRVDISVAAPLKQVAQRVLPNEIICKEGLELIIKNNGSPACVKPKTAEILIERGWAKQKQKQIELLKETEEREQEKFDPTIVQAAKKSIPGMQSLPKEILKQCKNVRSFSDYEIFDLSLILMEDELVETIENINAVLTVLELDGYDKHPEVGPLIKETRNLAIETSQCIDEIDRKYGS